MGYPLFQPLRRWLGALAAFSQNHPLWLVVGVAFLARGGLSLAVWLQGGGAQLFMLPDSGTYLIPAESLARLGEFSSGGQPEISRTPGYPLLLVPGIWLGWPVAWAVAVQLVLGSATGALVWRTARLLTGDGAVALAAALLYGLEPLSANYTSMVMTETLFTFVLALVVWLLMEWMAPAGRWPWMACAGAAMGFLLLVRPIGLFLPILMGGYLALWLWRSGRLTRKSALAALWPLALFLALALIPSAAWKARNQAVAGYDGYSSIVDQNLYDWGAMRVLAVQEGVGLEEYWARHGMGYNTFLANHPELGPLTQAEYYRLIRRQGMEIILRNLPDYLPLHLKSMGVAMGDPGAVDLLQRFGAYPHQTGLLARLHTQGAFSTLGWLMAAYPLVFWLNVLMALLLALFWLLVALGAWRGPGGWGWWAVALTAVYFIGVSGITLTHGRFRIPVVPQLAILAGVGLVWGWRAWQKEREANG